MNKSTQDTVNKIRKMRQFFAEKQPIMTQFERESNYGEIKNQVEMHYKTVATEAVQDWENSISKVRDALHNMHEAKRREIERWDASKLQAEMAVCETFLKLATSGRQDPMFSKGGGKPERIRDLMDEAEASGNGYKMRAVSELVGNLDPHNFQGRDKEMVAIMAGRARSNMLLIRTTPEMLAASGKHTEAMAELRQARKELIDVAETMGSQDPAGAFAGDIFGKALRLVQFKNGETVFHDWDDKEVRGFSLEKLGDLEALEVRHEKA